MFQKPETANGVRTVRPEAEAGPVLEACEPRLLLSASVFSGGAWLLYGDTNPGDLDDVIVVRQDPQHADQVEAVVNGDPVASLPRWWVGWFYVEGGEGDDEIRIELPGPGWVPGATVYGGSGNDTIVTGGGHDVIFGGPGDDVIDSGSGNDTVYGQGGDDVITGGGGYDVLLGGAGNDVIDGGGEADVLYGGGGDDQLVGGEGADVLLGQAGTDDLFGGDGYDVLYAGDGGGSISGGPSADVLIGGSGNDVLDGGGGNDVLYGYAGTDELTGGDGHDALYGGPGGGVLDGGPGNDVIVGGTGADEIIGGSGNDVLYGIAGADSLSGGEGNDVLRHGAGGGPLDGGPGDDVIVGGYGPNDIFGGPGRDVLYGIAGGNTIDGGDDDDVIYGGAGEGTLSGGAGDDIVFGNTSDDVLTGGPGNDRLYGIAGDDMLDGGDGDDYLYGPAGAGTLFGGPGNDMLFGNYLADLINGGDGDDQLYGNAGDDILDGGEGRDLLAGGAGANQIYGSAEDDWLYLGALDVLLEPAAGDLAAVPSAGQLQQMWIRTALDRYAGWFGQEYSPYRFDGGLPVELSLSPTSAILTGADDYSQTNNQEAGVDEGDLVKTDGDHLYVLSGSDVVIVETDPADGLEVVSRVSVEGSARAMYLYGGRIVVLSSVYDDSDLPEPVPLPRLVPGDAGAPVPMIDRSLEIALWRPWFYRPTRVKVTIVDATDAADPRTVEETYLDGSLVDSRTIEDDLFLVVRNDYSLPIPWPVLDEATGKQVYESEGSYVRRLRDWLAGNAPGYTAIGGGGQRQGSLLPTDSLVGGAGADDNAMSVIRFDVDDDEIGPAATTTVVGLRGEVYASADSLYVVADNWWWGGDEQIGGVETNSSSTIHKFDLTDPDVPLIASGAVPGRILNQFSMDEEGGSFRIATNYRTAGTQANGLFVLEQAEERLEIIGSLTDLAVTESIYSVRFIGEKAFVVTFLRIDPLWTIDLSDPTSPAIIGELEVPGYSSYLHQIDDGHLVGLGRAEDPARPGRVLDLQMSLFDVSDFADPIRVDQYAFGGTWSTTSEAENEHHAFAFYPEHGVMALPVRSDYSAAAALHVFSIDVDKGFTFLGAIAHDGPVRRSVRIEERLYSISGSEISVHPIADPTDELAAVKWEPNPVWQGDPAPLPFFPGPFDGPITLR